MTEILVAIAFLILAAFYLSWRASRLDRLHTRVETARAALDAALVRRSAIALELAASRRLDPATSLLLAAAAHEARTAGPDEREMAESDLSKAMRAAVEQPRFRESLAETAGGADTLNELDESLAKVVYSRRFYNNAVATTRAARRRPLVRALRLAGSAELPAFFDIDDDPPEIPPTGG
ncbi:hypothetical protein [Bailinhaonella thermotolerans]|uniref:LemA family protein n=1 Tax=Bailinhaonella thermotolerans TaxID=1070861 RepID=A0A3A4B607_9ACTN|nr:hypothetical protein [Bailinhaonella thermotolerans]RJL33997.1 hypothetical protein D5H75_05590 [Bailinhaonella thermotolerans]